MPPKAPAKCAASKKSAAVARQLFEQEREAANKSKAAAAAANTPVRRKSQLGAQFAAQHDGDSSSSSSSSDDEAGGESAVTPGRFRPNGTPRPNPKPVQNVGSAAAVSTNSVYDEFGDNAACGAAPAKKSTAVTLPEQAALTHTWEAAETVGEPRSKFTNVFRVRFLAVALLTAVIDSLKGPEAWRAATIMDTVVFFLVQVLLPAGMQQPLDKNGEPMQPTLGCIQLVGCDPPVPGDICELLSPRDAGALLWKPGDKPGTYILATISKKTGHQPVKTLAQAAGDLIAAGVANGWDPASMHFANNLVVLEPNRRVFIIVSCRTSNKKDVKSNNNNSNGSNRGSTGGDIKIIDKETTYWLQLQQVPDEHDHVIRLPALYEQMLTCAFSASQVPRVAGPLGGPPRNFPKPQDLIGRHLALSHFAVVAQRTEYKTSGRELVVKHWARIAVPEWIAEDAAGTVRQRNSF
jgi:hypothetical protein